MSVRVKIRTNDLAATVTLDGSTVRPTQLRIAGIRITMTPLEARSLADKPRNATEETTR